MYLYAKNKRSSLFASEGSLLAAVKKSGLGLEVGRE